MKRLCDYHVHTIFSDGRNTPEEIVKAAIQMGMAEIGFSDHSYTYFDESYCMKRDKIAEYKNEIARLKEKYKGEIKVLCGIEQDFYSAESADDYDYAIGSMHYVKVGDKFYPIDESEEIFVRLAKDFFGGDFYAFADEYYNTIAGFAEMKAINIIGHFDLIAKFNANNRHFDENNEKYVRAWKKAVDKLVAANKTFEINTGAITRGFRKEPYPSDTIRAYIRNKDGKFIITSDTHSAAKLCADFDKVTY